MKRSPMRRTQFGMSKMRDMGNPIASAPRRAPDESVDSIEESSLKADSGHQVRATVKPLLRGTYGPATLTPLPRAPSPVRDEKYRRLVASLPCYQCGIQGYSQAAHPNTNKAKGLKASDLECFPMCCTRPGVVGCHFALDQHKLVPRSEEAAYEAKAKEWTQTKIKEMT